MEDLLKNPLVLIGVAVVLLFGGKFGLSSVTGWIGKLFKSNGVPLPVDLASETTTLQTAVSHYTALREHCKDSEEALRALDVVWKCLPGTKTTLAATKPQYVVVPHSKEVSP